MKKLTILISLIFILGMFTSASAIDRTGTFAVGGHVGYSFGFGDAFNEMEWTEQWGTSNWGFKYGVTPNLALMACVDYRAGDMDVSGTFGGYTGSASATYDWTNVTGNAVITFSPEKNTCPYLTFGTGIYFSEDVSKPGINLGGGIEHFFQENLAFDAGTRYHMIFTEGQNTNYLNVYAGLNYYIGVK